MPGLGAARDRPRRRLLVSRRSHRARRCARRRRTRPPPPSTPPRSPAAWPRRWQAPASTRGIALEIEPGRAVYGSAGLHLSPVLNVKRQAAPVPRVWVGCDSSEVLLSDTGWEHSRWEPVCADPSTGRRSGGGRGRGQLRLRHDHARRAAAGRIAAGDVIAFLATGAYEETLAGNFNSMPRPASVLVSGDRAELVRRAETLADVTRARPPAAAAARRRAAGGGRRPRLADGRRPRPLGRSSTAACWASPCTTGGRLEPELIEQMTGMPNAEVDYADVDLGVTDPRAAAPPLAAVRAADRVPAGAAGLGAHRPAG